MSEIHLIDKKNFGITNWPQTPWGKKVSEFYHPFIENGIETYIPNIKTDLKVLQTGEFVLPIAVNEKEYQNSYVLSNYYGVHLLKEMLKKKHPSLSPFISSILFPLKGVMRALKINRVVHMNPWFFPASLTPQTNSIEMKAIRDYLVKHYPSHLLMFRSVTNYVDNNLYDALKNAGFLLVPTREIFFYDPTLLATLSKKAQYHRRKDTRLFEASGYEIVRGEECQKEDMERIVELYHNIYVDKYTSFSPQFSLEFVLHAMHSKALHIIALKKEGRVDAVIGYQRHQQMMQVPFMGYDQNVDKSVGLYRITSLLAYLEADKEGLYYHDGHGADSFKTYRGLKKSTEYTAIYADHLNGLRHFSLKIAKRYLNRLTHKTSSEQESVVEDNQ